MTEAEDMAADFIEDLEEVLSESASLIRYTSTTDSAGIEDDTATTTIPINCRIMPLSDKNRLLADIGQVTGGDSIGYFEPVYTYSSVDYTVAEGDIIKKSSTEVYRIQKILHVQHAGSTPIYLKALLKRT